MSLRIREIRVIRGQQLFKLETEMIFDLHVHTADGAVNHGALLAGLKEAGVAGCGLMSLPPESFSALAKGPTSPTERLDNLFAWTGGSENLYPIYWIDPTEKDALKQVAMALGRGVKGFKTIPNHFYPGDSAAMDAYRAIAKANVPLLFHSGILWDGTPSSKYCRPVEFEAMIDVPRLRFSLAHISWPWVDECLAVYGKFLSTKRARPDVSCEMFIDLTPGTPGIYRKEALTKIHTIGYNIADNVMFGTDCSSTYGPEWAKTWIDTDNAIYDGLALKDETREKIYHKNFMRFFG